MVHVDPEGVELVRRTRSGGLASDRGTNHCESFNRVLEDQLSAPRMSAEFGSRLCQIFVVGYNLRIGVEKLGQPPVPTSDMRAACKVITSSVLLVAPHTAAAL